jgi:[acyl-carrier-protein] S-malonyltransferase
MSKNTVKGGLRWRWRFSSQDRACSGSGWARAFSKAFPELQEFYKLADKVTGRPISKLCFEGPEEELTQTINAQPAIFTTCFACWVLVSERGLQPKFVAGHSLGEWTGGRRSGALEFEDGLKLVAKRGELMQQAPAGSMAAILGASLEQVEKFVRRRTRERRHHNRQLQRS